MRLAMKLGAVAVLLAACSLGAAAEDEKDGVGPAKLVGTWNYVSGVKDGAKSDKAVLKDAKVIITKETITLKGTDTFVLSYKLDAKKKPATLAMTITKGPFGAGAKSTGIVELKGDELTICYDPAGKTTPKKFEAKKDSKLHLFVLKRAK